LFVKLVQNLSTWDEYDWESKREMQRAIGPIAGGAAAAGAAAASVVLTDAAQVAVVAGLIAATVVFIALIAYRIR
jgi:hypothetical protein